MFRVKDADLTDEQLLALVGQLVRIEYAYRESSVMAGEGSTAVGIVTEIELSVESGIGKMGRVTFRDTRGESKQLWFNGGGYCTLYFTTLEDA